MKTPLILAILAGAAAGAGASLVASALTPAPAPAAGMGSGPAAVTRGADELAPLRSQLQELRLASERLEARIAGLELGPREARAPASAGETQELAALRGEVEELMLALRSPDVSPPPSFQSAVRRTLAEVREEDQRRRELEREQERIERFEQRVDRIAAELELAPYQVAGFREALAESEARREAAMALAREGTDWGAARDAMRGLRDDTQRALSGILTPEQIERFNDLQNPRFGRGGGGAGGGGRGGFGGRGGGGQGQ